MVTARISSNIVVDVRELPPGVEAGIKAHLTIANEDRARAIKRGDFGAEDMPEFFDVWAQQGYELSLPRGFAQVFVGGLERSGSGVRWVDETTAPSVDLWMQSGLRVPTMKPDQERIVQDIIRHRQGLVVAPTGSGKTVLVLEAWRRLGLRGLVLVEKGHLLRQWRDRAVEHLGYEPGVIGDGQWEERDLTIAMLQTLYRRSDQLGDEWYGRWGFVNADEAHHLVAPAFSKVVVRSPARVLLGTTATALDDDWRRPFLEATVGPVITSSDHSELAPTIRVVRTRFQWTPRGKDGKLVDPKVIYKRIEQALLEDGQRTMLVARKIVEQPPRCAQIVISRRLEQLDRIGVVLKELEYGGDVLFLRGKESLDQRQAVYERAGEGGCVVLSTVGGEGLDIPRLDRLHMPWPSRKSLSVIQYVGRILRPHDGKLAPEVFDYVDADQGVLYSQFRSRLYGVYRDRGWNVDMGGSDE